MNWVYVVNSVGLILDFVGFVIIFNNGVPSFKDASGKRITFKRGGFRDEDEKAQQKAIKLSERGVYFVIYGFLIQLFCSIYQIFF